MQSKYTHTLSRMSLAQKQTAYRRKTAAQRKQELIDAGIACLGKGGMSAFTIDQICTEARVSRGLINHHFNTKEDLLVRIYADMTRHLVLETSDPDPRRQLAEIIEVSFDRQSFNKSNLRAWLSIWSEVANIPALARLHRQRYRDYTLRIVDALDLIASRSGIQLDSARIARQMVALIDGLWLEYCLHSDGFSLASARSDCYQFLQAQGVAVADLVRREQG